MYDSIQKIVKLESEIKTLTEVNAELELKILELEQTMLNEHKMAHGEKFQVERLNCWEFKKCGRGPGGDKIEELGACPAAEQKDHKDANHGVAGGRICWALAGTLCEGKVQGVYADKIDTCVNCEFYDYVRMQEKQNIRYVLPTRKK